MTDNDAAKALDRLESDLDKLLTAIPRTAYDDYGTITGAAKADIDYIRAACAKSAKVDGLLEALNKITRVKTLPDHSLNTFNLTTVHLIANEALQRFNGEV